MSFQELSSRERGSKDSSITMNSIKVFYFIKKKEKLVEKEWRRVEEGAWGSSTTNAEMFTESSGF